MARVALRRAPASAVERGAARDRRSRESWRLGGALAHGCIAGVYTPCRLALARLLPIGAIRKPNEIKQSSTCALARTSAATRPALAPADVAALARPGRDRPLSPGSPKKREQALRAKAHATHPTSHCSTLSKPEDSSKPGAVQFVSGPALQSQCNKAAYRRAVRSLWNCINIEFRSCGETSERLNQSQETPSLDSSGSPCTGVRACGARSLLSRKAGILHARGV